MSSGLYGNIISALRSRAPLMAIGIHERRPRKRIGTLSVTVSIQIFSIILIFFTCPSIASEETSPEHPYPSYRGNGSGAPPTTGVNLVDSWKHVRIAWRSEEQIPPLTSETCCEFDKGGCGHAGYASPVVAHGRLYLAYWQASGPVLDKGANKGRRGYPAKMDADEILVCVDAETGKTIWRTVYQGTGYNYVGMYFSDGQITATVSGDRVFFQGALGRAYCLDAHTGEKLWDKPSSNLARLCEQYKGEVLAGNLPVKRGAIPPGKSILRALASPEEQQRQGGSGGTGPNASPAVYDDVVVFNSFGEAVGFDIHDGTERWRLPKCFKSVTSPARLRFEDRRYLFCVPSGRLVNPANGKIVGTSPVPLVNGFTPATSGPYVIAESQDKDKKGSFVVCLRLEQKELKVAWHLPPGAGMSLNSPVIMNGLAYIQIRLTKKSWEGLSETERKRFLPADYSGPDIAPVGRKGVGFKDKTSGCAGGDDMILCLDLANGKVIGINFGSTMNSLGAMPFGMENRLFIGTRAMYNATADERGILPFLGGLADRPTRCCNFTGYAGKLFVRVDKGPELIRCYDPTAMNSNSKRDKEQHPSGPSSLPLHFLYKTLFHSKRQTQTMHSTRQSYARRLGESKSGHWFTALTPTYLRCIVVLPIQNIRTIYATRLHTPILSRKT